jgi:hypothetical protein
MSDNRSLYLDPMKLVLLFQLWSESKLWRPVTLEPHPFYKKWIVELVVKHPAKSERRIMERVTFSDREREIASDLPPLAHTMIKSARLDNLQQCCEAVIHDCVPGDLIETGVWRGGACILQCCGWMSLLAARLTKTTRVH